MLTPIEAFEARKGQGIPLKWLLQKYKAWVKKIETETKRSSGILASEKLANNKEYQKYKRWINDIETKLKGSQKSLFIS